MDLDIDYLCLEAIREHANKVFKFAKAGNLPYFDQDVERLPYVAKLISSVISGYSTIPTNILIADPGVYPQERSRTRQIQGDPSS